MKCKKCGFDIFIIKDNQNQDYLLHKDDGVFLHRVIKGSEQE